MKLPFVFYTFAFLFTSAFANKRIIGGQDAKLGMFPYMVLIAIDQNQMCSGALISPRWILTAAHCIGKYKTLVAAGFTNIDKAIGHFKKAKRTIRHPKYIDNDQLLGAYDLGLIEIEPFDMTNKNIGILKLETNRWRGKSHRCTAVGFGYTKDTKEPGYVGFLKYARVTASYGKENCNCSKRFEEYIESVICLDPKDERTPCHGDSGGPLVCYGKCAGVSHAILQKDCNDPSKLMCGSPNTTPFYMYLYPFIGWIRLYAKDLPHKPVKGENSNYEPSFRFTSHRNVFTITLMGVLLLLIK